MSSFESMSKSLNSEFWHLHGDGVPDKCTHVDGNQNSCTGANVLAERNYPCDTHVLAHFGNFTTTWPVGATTFQAQLYQCLMAQTLWMKGEIEKRRSANSYGLLIWQMNENWPTGGWGCIEFSTQGKSQKVLGGRWKPLMYLLKSSLLQDLFAACGHNNECYVRNDGQLPRSADVRLESWNLTQQFSGAYHFFNVVLRPSEIRKCTHFRFDTYLPHISISVVFLTDRFSLPPNFTAGKNVVFVGVADHTEKQTFQENTYLWTYPKNMVELREPVTIRVPIIRALDDTTAEVVLLSTKVALFVVLSTEAEGHFTENAFTLRPNTPKV